MNNYIVMMFINIHKHMKTKQDAVDIHTLCVCMLYITYK